MRYKVPDAEPGKGVKPIDYTLPACKTGEHYVFECGSAQVKESKNSPCLIHEFPMVVLDGPENVDGKSTAGRKYTHRIIQLLEDHESYDPTNKRWAEELADLCWAAGVNLDEEGYDPEDFAGKHIVVVLGMRQGKGPDGETRNENVVRQVKAEDGTTHLFLSDDGKPASKRTPSRAGAPRRR